MEKSDTATLIKIQQFRLFEQQLGVHAPDVGALFKKYGVLEYIDDAYEFLHIQGKFATYEDISDYLTSCRST